MVGLFTPGPKAAEFLAKQPAIWYYRLPRELAQYDEVAKHTGDKYQLKLLVQRLKCYRHAFAETLIFTEIAEAARRLAGPSDHLIDGEMAGEIRRSRACRGNRWSDHRVRQVVDADVRWMCRGVVVHMSLQSVFPAFVPKHPSQSPH